MSRRPDLKALLVNDASLSGHHGSALVTSQIVRLAARAGIEVADGWTWEAALDVIARGGGPFDLVIVNGEGSVHSDSRAAKRIAQIATDLAGNSQLPAYLINATVEGNSSALDRDLGQFRLRFVRDAASRTRLARVGVAADVVHDLTLTASDLPRAGGRGSLLVTDASDQEATGRLIRIGQEWQARAITLRTRPPAPACGRSARQMGFDLKRQLARLSPLSPWSLRYGRASASPAFLHRLANDAGGIICGRYHAVCLALRMELPFVAIAGNTGKTGALLADAGLDSRATTLEELETSDRPLTVPPFSDAEQRKIRAFLAAVEDKAPDMFRQIAADAQRHAAPARAVA